jgi:hypothetical protein
MGTEQLDTLMSDDQQPDEKYGEHRGESFG